MLFCRGVPRWSEGIIAIEPGWVAQDDAAAAGPFGGARSRAASLPLRPLLATALFYLVLAVGLSVAVARSGTFALDLRVTQAVQRHPFPGSRFIELFGYAIGSSAVLIPLGIAAAFWLFVRRRPDIAWLFVGVLLLRPLNTLLKAIIESPRPSAAQVDVLRESGGNGFPSGHVTGTVLMAGVVFYLAPAIAAPRGGGAVLRALAVVAVVATCYSRVASGAHWPTDVVGGLLWGGAQLLALVAAVNWLHRRSTTD